MLFTLEFTVSVTHFLVKLNQYNLLNSNLVKLGIYCVTVKLGFRPFFFFLIFNEYTAIWYLTCIFVVECRSPKNCDLTLPLCDPWLTLITYAWPLTEFCLLCVTPTWMCDPLSLHECISMTPFNYMWRHWPWTPSYHPWLTFCDSLPSLIDLSLLCVTPSYMYMWPLTNLGLLFMSFLGLDPDL